MDGGTPANGPEPPSDDSDLWIDEGAGPSRTGSKRRRTGIVLAVAACVALIGVPVGLLAASGPAPAPQASPQHHVTVSGGPAKRSVLAALSATTDSGNFAFSYQLTESPYQSSTAVEGPSCSATSCPPATVSQSTEVQGSGTINTNPDGNGGVRGHQLERSQRAPGRCASGSHHGLGGGLHRQRVDALVQRRRAGRTSRGLPALSRERSARGRVPSP